MTIPRIASYPLPGASDLPRSRASFEIDPSRALLLVHDLQEHFLDYFVRQQSPVSEMLTNTAALRDACHAAGVPVAYSYQSGDASRESRGLMQGMWGDGIVGRPHLSGFASEVLPRPHDHLVEKHRYSAFHRTGLHSIMEAEGRDQLWIAGIYGHIGCMLTASEAFMLDVQPFLIADAIADFSRDFHDKTLDVVANSSGVVVCTADLLTSLSATAARAESRASEDSPVLQLLNDELARLEVDVSAMAPEDELPDHGLDSVRLLELTDRLEERGIAVAFIDMAECVTLEAMRRYLRDLQPEEPAACP